MKKFKMDGFDFCGWATRNNILCSDGRTILKDAFKVQDGATVPLVWNHQHNSPDDVIGHAVLENREDGVYTYGYLNDTDLAKTTKALIKHGDVVGLSIYANKLTEKNHKVMHGTIREVSIVLATANPGAYIEHVVQHGEMVEDEAIIYCPDGLNPAEDNTVQHADEKSDDKKDEEDKGKVAEEKKDGKTVQDVIDSMSEEQKNVMYYLVGKALEDKGGSDDDDEEDKGVKHNAFEDYGGQQTGGALMHSEEMAAIIGDAKRYGSLKDSALAHGIDDIEYLFPDAQTLENTPSFIKRDMDWVSTVMNGVHHTPFSRIKSIHANITEDDARALGYIKGNYKKEEVFPLLKRTTTPQTVYKKQKLDRDDIIDITDFDVVAWLKTEMRFMLDEELARAFLVGDGRDASSDDKISDLYIRPIWTDADLYTIKWTVGATSADDADTIAKAFIRGAIKSRKDYKGSGSPTLFTTEDFLTDCLLMEDEIGHVLYDSEAKLATAMRVKNIVTVPVMEDLTRTNSDGNTVQLMGIIVNLTDYNVGADKGGAVNMFDDFDIDYNQQKYLIETRCSGALTQPYSAIALELPVSSGD
ncbi:MAG: HK97 family phage prohead protease [Oscillospiraceae bacterium]|nr:HK97 family phage prohead protease [Oscillospiraceae bacterium]